MRCVNPLSRIWAAVSEPQMAQLAPGVWAQPAISQLASLRAFQPSTLQRQQQQRAPYSQKRERGEQEEPEAGGQVEGGHLRRLQPGELHSKARVAETEVELAEEDDGVQGAEARSVRAARIGALLRSSAADPAARGAAAFAASFFRGGEAPNAAATAPRRADVAGEEQGAAGEGEEPLADEEEEASVGVPLRVDAPAALDRATEDELLSRLRGLRHGAQRVVLQKLLAGGMLRDDPSALRELDDIQKASQPSATFRMKVVDVNRTCKGTRAGGLYRFGAMVVVGNGEGVLGWGQGKAAELPDAVKKGYMRACKNLYPIPRYNAHTITERMEAKFGQVKVVMYPKSSGTGIVASTMVRDILKMAGLHDVGVKVHGSRNPRNTVKCLFEAIDKLRTHEEILEGPGSDGRLVLAVPPGRYGRLAQAQRRA